MRTCRGYGCADKSPASFQEDGEKMTEMIFEWMKLHQTGLQYLGALSILTLFITPIIVFALVIIMPEDYFLSDRDHILVFGGKYHPLVQIAILVLKNAIGVVFVLAGVAMLMLPGQGVLTILIGLTLINFPGKRTLERRIVSRERVHSAINWMRSKAGRPPLKTSRDEGE
jgi:hypothetical protein